MYISLLSKKQRKKDERYTCCRPCMTPKECEVVKSEKRALKDRYYWSASIVENSFSSLKRSSLARLK